MYEDRILGLIDGTVPGGGTYENRLKAAAVLAELEKSKATREVAKAINELAKVLDRKSLS